MYPEEFRRLICPVYGDSHERKVNYNKSAWEPTEEEVSPPRETEWLGRFTRKGSYVKS